MMVVRLSTVVVRKKELVLQFTHNLSVSMPRIARLITKFLRSEILTLFSVARLVHKSAGLDIKIAPRAGCHAHILIVIPRKYGTAPQRNLLRRRIKSIFYQEKLFEQAYDFLIFAKPAAKNYTFDCIRDLLIILSKK